MKSVLLVVVALYSLHIQTVQGCQAFAHASLRQYEGPGRGGPRFRPSKLRSSGAGACLKEVRRLRPLAPAISMQLEFPRREVQQSRQYNVAKVRGGYYVSYKSGDAPLEDIIASKTADAGREEAEKVDGAVPGKGLNNEEFAALIDTKPQSEAEAASSMASKYMPSLDPEDPIVKEIYRLELASRVLSFELLDSRWNGNEVFRYLTDRGSLFVKMNRVESDSVFMAEAVGLTSMLRTNTVTVPKPLHVGKLPKVGLFGPGAFIITEFFQLEPFGALKGANQEILGKQLAAMHTSSALDSVHKGR
jgi:hypothetical protein